MGSEALSEFRAGEAWIEAGFETAIAASAENAVTLHNGSVANFNALITDIRFKGMMNGWQVTKAAPEIDPAFPIVYMTGAAGGDCPHGVPNSILLEKPFVVAQLVTTVLQLLSTGTPLGSLIKNTAFFLVEDETLLLIMTADVLE